MSRRGRPPERSDRRALAGRLGRIAAALACLLPASAAAAEAPTDPRLVDYQRMLEWRYAAAKTPIPPAGLSFMLDDVAVVTLVRGGVRLAEPVAGMGSTGLVFDGEGTFVMEVPDPVELRQLRRFLGDAVLERIEQPFTRLVLRTSDGAMLSALAPPAGPFESDRLAAERHDHWLRIQRLDADARVLAAIGDPGDRFVRIDVDTEDHGWLSLTYDALRREEIDLTRFHPGHAVLESWLSLDRREDRLDDGRPGDAPARRRDLRHVEIVADLTEPSREPLRGLSRVQPVEARITARLDLELLDGPTEILQLYLHPLAEVTAVRSPDGRPLPFLRDAIGRRSSAIEKEIHDDSLLVLPPEPFSGRIHGLEIDYSMRLDGFARGRFWYPVLEAGTGRLADRHTARLRLTSRADHGVRATGRLVDERETDGRRATTWAVERPVKMVTLAFARRHHEAVVTVEGAPAVAVFGSLGGPLTEERVEAVAADVARATAYFQDLFASRLPVERLQAAIIPATHGQAFEGFLHIGDFSTTLDTVKAGELFRAHEVAHQWWGHKVGWLTYRDQWLSEALAEYSAMLYVEAAVEDGPRYFRQMLEAFGDEVRGSLRSSFSQFSRPGVSTLNRRAADRVGPIGHGFRCAVGEAPRAWISQGYTKGALVLHMLRVLAEETTGDADAFARILRTFADRFDGGYAATGDFQRVVEEVVGGDWSWFFEQWILGAEIPSYRWSHDLGRTADGGHELRLVVERREVSDGFRMPIPVTVTLADDRTETLLAVVDEARAELLFPLPERPRKVELDPHGAVLATVKKR